MRFNTVHAAYRNCTTTLSTTTLSTTTLSTTTLRPTLGLSPLLRSLSTVTVSDRKLARENEKKGDEIELKTPEYSNTKVIYRVKTTAELLRAYLVFAACSFDFLVDNQAKILKWTRRLLGRRIFTKLMEKTIFGQFMVREDSANLLDKAKQHANAGIGPMFAYTAGEFHGSTIDTTTSDKDSWFQRNVDEVQRSIEIAASCKEFSIKQAVVCTKVTFMAQFSALESLSHVITTQTQLIHDAVVEGKYGAQYKQEVSDYLLEIHRSCSQRVFQDLLLIPENDPKLLTIEPMLLSLMTNTQFHLALNKALHRIPLLQNKSMLTKTLSNEDIEALGVIWKRMTQLSKLASENGVLLNYDAEQTYIQPAIETLVLDNMRRFNKLVPCVLNTYQCYLKRTLKVVERDIKLADREGFCFGGKIVRGAYIDEETKRAKEKGYDNPVNPTYDATTEMYSEVTGAVLTHAKQQSAGKMRIIFGTHNQDTIQSVVNQLQQRNLNAVKYGISFAQLLGTRDFISFALGAAGYPAMKLIHYASPEEGLAYLSRRLMENRSGLPSPAIERRLLYSELKRRLLNRQ